MVVWGEQACAVEEQKPGSTKAFVIEIKRCPTTGAFFKGPLRYQNSYGKLKNQGFS